MVLDDIVEPFYAYCTDLVNHLKIFSSWENDGNTILSDITKYRNFEIANKTLIDVNPGAYNGLRATMHDLKNLITLLSHQEAYSRAGIYSHVDDSFMKKLILPVQLISTSVMDEFGLKKNNPEFIRVDDIYKAISDIAEYVNDRPDRKMTVKFKENGTKNRFMKLTDAAHYYRALHNMLLNKRELVTGDIEMLVLVDRYKGHTATKVYDDTGLPLPDEFGNPNDICSFGTTSREKTRGLGMYVACKLVHEKLHGSFEPYRSNNDFDDPKYDGAKFLCLLPNNIYHK